MKFSLKPLTNKILDALRQGTTPRMLAVTCAAGVVIGIFPVLGTTTLICLGIAVVFRLNIALLQLVNYVVAPLQLLLIIPFIKAGAFAFGQSPFPYSMDQLISLFKTDIWLLFREAGFSVLMGIAIWAVIAVPLFFIIFFPCAWFFNQWKINR